ncbi:hypothetical protein EDD21DRAFT_438310 [Dissophora ornata]|nr:hypothetical protein EDD21DRAFT_438310 [Dissophora ornata]
MKIQFLSLLVVASAALARPTPRRDMSPSGSELNRRTLIRDEYTFQNQHGSRHTTITKTIKESHDNGGHDRDSEISPGSFFDRRDMDVEDKDTRMEMRKTRSLERRGVLFGGDSTSTGNVNDNLQHIRIMNKHGNRDTTITSKIHRQPPVSRSGRHEC